MRELIYRDEAIKVVNDNEKIGTLSKWKIGWNSSLYYVRRKLEELPPAQPERKKGHWILYDKRFPWRYHYKCSECGNYLDFSGVNAGRGSANFCPNCGAKMEEKQYE